MRRTLSAPAWVQIRPEGATSYSYPQILGYHDPARLSRGPLVVTNPDAGSEAERVRNEAVERADSARHEDDPEQHAQEADDMEEP